MARSATDVWAVGDAGTLLHYDGISWSAVPVAGWPSTKSLRAIAFSGPTGWAVGDGLGAVCTTDTGATWSVLKVPVTGQPVLRSVAVVDGAKAIAVGDGGFMRALSTSESPPCPQGTGFNLGGVTFADSANGWAVGDNATFVRTVDGGATWTAVSLADVPIPTGLKLRSVAFADASNGMAVGTSQGVWRTSDGGAHWLASRIVDGLGSYDLKGVGFVAGNADIPVAVGRVYGGVLTQGTDKARAYRGTWSGLGVAPPTTPPAPLLPLASVYTPHAPSHAHHRVSSVYGYLNPYHKSKTYAVKLYFYRYQSGHYVLRKTAWVKVAYYKGYSKYSGRVSLPYAGKWRVRAVHSDSGHRASYSGYDYLTVK